MGLIWFVDLSGLSAAPRILRAALAEPPERRLCHFAPSSRRYPSPIAKLLHGLICARTLPLPALATEHVPDGPAGVDSVLCAAGAFIRVSHEESLPSRWIGADHLQTPFTDDSGVRLEQAAPRVLGFAALERHDLDLRHQPQQQLQDLDAGLKLGRLRRAVDLPGVGVPGSDVSRRNPRPLEEPDLKLRCRIVVLHAQKSGTGALLRLGARVPAGSTRRAPPRLRARVNVRHPATPVLVAQGVDHLIDRTYVGGIAPLLYPERLVPYSSRHNPSNTGSHHHGDPTGNI